MLFFGYAMFAAVDWLYSLIPVRFPDIKICLSEGGIGWVPALLDRLDHMLSYHEMYGTWTGIELTPAEVLQRNFWFCAVEDPSAFALRERIGVDHILLEADYPHCDSTWPDTQAVIEREIGGLPPDDIRKITWENASTLYRHPVPARGAGRPRTRSEVTSRRQLVADATIGSRIPTVIGVRRARPRAADVGSDYDRVVRRRCAGPTSSCRGLPARATGSPCRCADGPGCTPRSSPARRRAWSWWASARGPGPARSTTS